MVMYTMESQRAKSAWLTLVPPGGLAMRTWNPPPCSNSKSLRDRNTSSAVHPQTYRCAAVSTNILAPTKYPNAAALNASSRRTASGRHPIRSSSSSGSSGISSIPATNPGMLISNGDPLSSSPSTPSTPPRFQPSTISSVNMISLAFCCITRTNSPELPTCVISCMFCCINSPWNVRPSSRRLWIHILAIPRSPATGPVSS
mmetsp:Transcript_1196/g.3878  ORF Transcript_1196/g.3878 Transcript_1196/m.3878 type:complete len:201 (-) Transcript_1196:380-982(-)